MVDKRKRDPKDEEDQELRERNQWLTKVSNYGMTLQTAPEKFKGCREIVLAAVENTGKALSFASDLMKDDEQIVRAAIRSDPKSLTLASERLRNDKALALLALKRCSTVYCTLSETLKSDPDVEAAYNKRFNFENPSTAPSPASSQKKK